MKIRFALLAIITILFLIYPLAVGAQDRYVLFRSFPEGPGLDNPYDLAVDSTRNVYVADTNNDRIQKFSMFGDLLGVWGSGDGKLNKPRSIAVDKSGNVYVTDTDNHRILKFSSNGAFIAKWGKRGSGNGEYFKPGGIAIDGSGYMYIADTENHRIQKLAPNGDFVTKWGSNGSGDGQFSFPEAISADSSGNVYVIDINNRRIQKFDSTGNFLMKFDKIGLKDGEIVWPRSVANDSSDNLYVADGYNGRIQKFDSEGNFLAKWGTSGTGDGQYLSLRGIDVSSTGEICVTDSGNNRIHVLDSSGMFLSKWGISGSGNGQFLLPKGLAKDSAGNIYVADTGNNRIQKFSPNGDFILKWGSVGSGDGQFLSPSGVAVDRTGNIYVVDWLNNRIQKFDPYGVLLPEKLGGPGTGDGQFTSPFGIAIDTSGNIYVADWLNHRIQKFDPNGIFILKWGVLGGGNGEFNSPRGIAIDLYGSVYVTDTGNCRIQKFSSNGDYIFKWGIAGTGDSQFMTPWAVATDTAGNVYVSDYGNHRIQKFDSNGRFLTKWGAEGNPSDLLRYPYGVMVDDRDDVYVADAGNQCIRKYRRSAGNTPPTANSKILTTFEDTPTQIVLSGRDPDGDALSYRIVMSPTHGTITGSPPNLTYTPNLNYSGSDSLVFTVRDSSVESAPAIIQINVNPVNDPPISDPQTVPTNEDTLVIIALTGSDPDGDKLTYFISEGPQNGTLSGDLPTVTYTPKADFSGTDSFTFFVSDGVANSAVAMVNITVSSVNDPPIANPDTIKIDEDSSIQITLKGSDPEGNSITFKIVSNPSKGTLEGIPPNVTYKPNANYSGTDSFTFKVNDGSSDSPPAKIDITVNPINDKPTIKAFSITTKEDTNYQFTLRGEDLDGDTLIFNYSKPQHGIIFGTPPNFVYKPDANYFGSDSFTYTADDGFIKSDPATVTITVESVNDAPVANPQTVRTPEDTPLKIILTGSDIEKDPLSFKITDEPSKGILEGTPPEITYKPNENYNGEDSFKFLANDSQADSQSVAVTITIDPVNDPPTADPKFPEVLEGGSVEIVLTGSDIENDNIIFEIVDQPANGSLSGNPPVLIYNPKSSFFGSDSFTYLANDGNSDGEPAKVSIKVIKVNDPPSLTLAELSFFTDEDTPVQIKLKGYDPDNDPLTFKVLSQPAHGTLEGEPPILTYIPKKDFNGNDGFEIIANDGEVDSNVGTVSMWVKPVNDPPALKPQSVTTDEETPIKITLSGTDIDSPKVTNYKIVDNPLHGTISGKPPEVIYTPNLNFNGEDSFTFTASDEKIDGEPAKISIAVKPVNDPPTAGSQSIATNEDTPVKIALTGSDIDGDSLTFKIANQPKNGILEVELPELFYKPNTDFNGDDSFTFIANDGTVDSQLGIVFIKVPAINDTPVAEAKSLETDENKSVIINLSGKDAEGDTLVFKIIDQPKNGTIKGTPPELTYQPNYAFGGDDSFTYLVNDGKADSEPVAVNIKVKSTPNPYDVNRDGIVNILDIIFVSKYLGKTDFPLDNNPDVNRDKKVDNKDIDAVIQNFGKKQ